MGIKGYKVFNPDWTCHGFQYEVGKTYKHEGNIEMCGAGFHFCRRLYTCFSYYAFDSRNKVAEVEAIGHVTTFNDKSVTDEITILRELTWYEVLDLVNTGKDCTGIRNSGDHNSGNGNSGNWNSGNRNSGNCNSGDYNSGDYNSGDWNSISYSSGFFNSEEQPLYAFNKKLNISRDVFLKSRGIDVLLWNYENNWWIHSNNMTDEEKAQHPEHETTGGYLKVVDFKTACKMMWEQLDDGDKWAVKEIPNFDAEVFKEITGIDVEEG